MKIEQETTEFDMERRRLAEERRQKYAMPKNGEMTREEREARIWAFL